MTRDEIITQLFKGKNFNDCLQKMEPQELREDLRQEVILVICELNEDKVQKLYHDKVLEFYTVRVIINMVNNPRKPFYKKFRIVTQPLTNNEIADTFEVEERALKEMIEDMAIKEVDRLYWYNKGLIELYLKYGNYRAITKETGIPLVSCYSTIKKSFNEIKLKVR